MIVKDLNGKEFRWNPRSNPRNAPSILHCKARDLIKELFPCELIYEEVYINQLKFYLDLYIPSCKIVIEVQGGQHSKFTPYYHSTKLDFYKAKQNDARKKEWCELNGLTFVELPFNEDINDWKRRLNR